MYVIKVVQKQQIDDRITKACFECFSIVLHYDIRFSIPVIK